MKRLLLFTILKFSTLSTFACSCSFIPFKDAVEWVDEIFIGRLVEIKEVEYEVSHQNNNERYTRLWYAKFEVSKKWKGSDKKYIKVYQPSTSCDAEFNQINRTYLVYAKKKRVFTFFNTQNTTNELTTWLCARNREYWFVNEKEDSDYFKLNKIFPNEVKVYNYSIINWKLYFYGILILFAGFFLGVKTKKATH
ncbi:hypothetical protein [Tenacibaculum sp. 190524A05c]|uniref:Tissue inhibitor of metalloproteinase n=1 Tax=Tenacibaculum platacis TaxID=3137852 RepID=A0ABM9NUI3_9FLAO